MLLAHLSKPRAASELPDQSGVHLGAVPHVDGSHGVPERTIEGSFQSIASHGAHADGLEVLESRAACQGTRKGGAAPERRVGAAPVPRDVEGREAGPERPQHAQQALVREPASGAAVVQPRGPQWRFS